MLIKKVKLIKVIKDIIKHTLMLERFEHSIVNTKNLWLTD